MELVDLAREEMDLLPLLGIGLSIPFIGNTSY